MIKKKGHLDARRPRFRVLGLLWANPIFSLILGVSTIHIKGYCRHWCQGLISESLEGEAPVYLSLCHSESRVCLAHRRQPLKCLTDLGNKSTSPLHIPWRYDSDVTNILQQNQFYRSLGFFFGY